MKPLGPLFAFKLGTVVCNNGSCSVTGFLLTGLPIQYICEQLCFINLLPMVIGCLCKAVMKGICNVVNSTCFNVLL